MKRIMIKTVLLIIIGAMIVSCDNSAPNEFYPTIELNNESLKDEITSFCDKCKIHEWSSTTEDAPVIYLYAREINDSVKRFIISIDDNPDVTPIVMPFLFTCKVGQYNVFVCMPVAYQKKKNAKNFFRLSDESFQQFKKKYFPITTEREEKTGVGSYTFTHKDSRFLTFLNDSLIDCTDKMGHVYEKIKVRVRDKYIEY